MTNKEIKQAVEDYFNEMFAKNADYLDCITDSWIYDAEDWFRHKYNLPDWDESEDTPEEVEMFWKIALERKNELYDERYGERDAKYSLHCIKYDVKTLLEKYNSVKHHFKKFNAYTEAVASQFEELEKQLQLLDDIENDKVESLNKGE
jgi:hypothetical protein